MSKLEKLIKEFCPSGVEHERIGDIAEVSTGKSNGNEAQEDGKYPFFIRSQTVKAKDDYEFDEEAIIIPGEGGVGDIFHYVKGKYALHQRVYRIHFFTNRIYTKFAFHYMRAHFKSYIMQKAVSATVTSIRKPMIEDFQIPVPPLPVQEEIVRILDSFTELTAELTANLTAEITARKKQYEYYRDSLLTISNEKIAMSRLDSIAKFTYGYTDKAKDSGSVRFIRITDISDNGTLNPNDAKFIDLTDESKKYLLHKGDIVMARTGATFGKTLYVPDDTPSVYASFLIKITLDNSKISNRFYWHFAQSNLYWEQANKLVSAGGQPQFNASAVGRVLVPVPPLETQNKIVQILDNFDSICSDLKIGLPAEIEARKKQYEFYRDKLLSF